MNYDKALNAVKNMVACKGTDILYDKEEMPAMFKELVPELTEEYETLKVFYDNELYSAFSETTKDISDRDNTLRVLTRRLTSEFSVKPELAGEVIDILAVVLGWNEYDKEEAARGMITALVNRVLNNKRKLYILAVIGVAIAAAIIILVVFIVYNGGMGSSKTQPVTHTTEAPAETTEIPEPPDVSDVSEAETDAPTETAEEAEATPEADAEQGSTAESVTIELPVDTLAAALDSTDDDYKSFDTVPVDSPDFFLNRNMRLVATLKDHQMTMYYDQNITATYGSDTLSMSFTNSDGEYQKLENYVYGVTDKVTTPGGRNCYMLAFGDHRLTEENKSFSTDCFALVRMNDTSDMGDAAAEAYVLLIEDAMTDTVELFKLE